MAFGPAMRAWQAMADEVLSSLGVSESAGRALGFLSTMDPGTRQGELARTIGITEASLARTVQQLERAGLLTRMADAQDRRTYQLYLTAEGADLAKRISTRLSVFRSDLLAEVPDEALAGSIDVLRLFSSRIADRRSQA